MDTEIYPDIARYISVYIFWNPIHLKIYPIYQIYPSIFVEITGEKMDISPVISTDMTEIYPDMTDISENIS